MRLMKMLRVFRIAQIIQRYDEYIRHYVNSMKTSLMIMTLGLIAHAAGCLWYMIGGEIQHNSDNTETEGWALRQWDACNSTDDDGMAQIKICDGISPGTRYITSVYWAITTISVWTAKTPSDRLSSSI